MRGILYVTLREVFHRYLHDLSLAFCSNVFFFTRAVPQTMSEALFEWSLKLTWNPFPFTDQVFVETLNWAAGLGKTLFVPYGPV